MTAETLLTKQEEIEVMLLMSALAGFLGQRRIANVLNVASGWAECRQCHAEFEPLSEWGGI